MARQTKQAQYVPAFYSCTCSARPLHAWLVPSFASAAAVVVDPEERLPCHQPRSAVAMHASLLEHSAGWRRPDNLWMCPGAGATL